MSAIWNGSAWVYGFTGEAISINAIVELETVRTAAMITRRYGLDAAADDLDLLALAIVDRVRAPAANEFRSTLSLVSAAGRPPSDMV